METATENLSLIEKAEEEIDREIDNHDKVLTVLIANLSLKEGQAKSFNDFVEDEKEQLKAKIRSYGERHGEQIASLAGYQQYKIDEEYKSLVLSAYNLFKSNVAQFLLLLEI